MNEILKKYNINSKTDPEPTTTIDNPYKALTTKYNVNKQNSTKQKPIEADKNHTIDYNRKDQKIYDYLDNVIVRNKLYEIKNKYNLGRVEDSEVKQVDTLKRAKELVKDIRDKIDKTNIDKDPLKETLESKVYENSKSGKNLHIRKTSGGRPDTIKKLDDRINRGQPFVNYASLISNEQKYIRKHYEQYDKPCDQIKKDIVGLRDESPYHKTKTNLNLELKQLKFQYIDADLHNLQNTDRPRAKSKEIDSSKRVLRTFF